MRLHENAKKHGDILRLYTKQPHEFAELLIKHGFEDESDCWLNN